LCYAAIALQKYPGRAVKLTIIQPRAHHFDGPIRSWEPTDTDIAAMEARITESINTHKTGRHTYNAGDHCRWCPAKADCPELYKLTLETAQQRFDPEVMTAETAVDVLGRESAIGHYLKSVREWVAGKLEHGVDVPGLKLVDKQKRRYWTTDQETIVKKCRSRKLKKSDVVVQKLLSPAQLEKLTDRKFVSRFCESKSSGTTVVAEADRRPAVVGLTPSEAFADVEVQVQVEQ